MCVLFMFHFYAFRFINKEKNSRRKKGILSTFCSFFLAEILVIVVKMSCSTDDDDDDGIIHPKNNAKKWVEMKMKNGEVFSMFSAPQPRLLTASPPGSGRYGTILSKFYGHPPTHSGISFETAEKLAWVQKSRSDGISGSGSRTSSNWNEWCEWATHFAPHTK